jgi:hypothetical protein
MRRRERFQTATNNNISQTDANGILLVARGTSGRTLSIKNNTVAAPLAGTGMRVDARNASSRDDALCLDISGNTGAGAELEAKIGAKSIHVIGA